MSRKIVIALIVAFAGLFSISLGAEAFAKGDSWARCRGGDPDERIASCTEIVALGNRETKRDRIAAYINRGGAYRAKGDLDRAITDLDRALQLDKALERFPIRLNRKAALHLCFVAFSRREPASGSLENALVGAYANRARAHRGKGELDKALIDFNKAIELDPEFAEAFLDRANAYCGNGDPESARRDFEAASKLDPQLAAARESPDEVNKLVVERAAPPATASPSPALAPTLQESTHRPMRPSPLESTVLFHLGPVPITEPVAITWAIMALLSVTSLLVTRRLQLEPNRRQAVLELVVTGILEQIEDVIRKDARPFLPLLGTLFIFLVAANLSGLLPGGEAPTSKIETPAALALIVFVSVHFFGVRARGVAGYLASFAEPKLIMLPLNIVSEVTRTFSLMVRLFGNVMSGEFVIALVVGLAGLFVPIPLMVLEILVGIVQAYIFTVLATVFIGAAIGSVAKE